MDNQPNNPLHGVKLADMVEHLVSTFGWEVLGEKISINCFNSNPSIKSSLKFLRKTPWAREKVERLYLQSIGKRMPRRKPVVQPPTKTDTKGIEKVDGESPWDAARKKRESRRD
jgi:uncharacterized protein (DUF2132 family)